MAYCPDFSSDDEDLLDDPDYYDFKERIRSIAKAEISPKELQETTITNAISQKNIETLTHELDNGFDIDGQLQGGWTPLFFAVSMGNYLITEELITRGADIHALKDNDCTVLMLACSVPDSTSPFEETLKIIKLLVEKGVNVKKINRKRMTALMFAACSGHLEAVKFLLPLSDKNAQDNQKWTALFWSVLGKNCSVVRYLLEEELDSSATDVRGDTVVDVAKTYNCDEVVEIFTDDNEDLMTQILNNQENANNMENLKQGEMPRFFLDICNIIYGLRCESLLKVLYEKNVSLLDFLSMSEEELKEIGVALSYQRRRILSGLYRFHRHPFLPKSLLVIQTDDVYSNYDVWIQLHSAMKQIISMEASLKFILKHYNDSMDTKQKQEIAQYISNIRIKTKLLRLSCERISEKSKMWDEQSKLVDLMTFSSSRSRFPWRKTLLFCSIGCYACIKCLKYFK